MTIKFTDNKQIRDSILQQIRETGRCPAMATHPHRFSCPCDEFENIEEGTCQCGLLVKIKDPWDL